MVVLRPSNMGRAEVLYKYHLHLAMAFNSTSVRRGVGDSLFVPRMLRHP